MTVEERFKELISRYAFNQNIICEDVVTGLKYTTVAELPADFAKQSAKCAYFEFRYKFARE
jgi:hypothetical protein